MNLVHDYVHPTTHGGRCRVRLYLPEGAAPVVPLHPVVILTELPDNPGMSITNDASELAGQIITGHGFEEIPVFIEHYLAASHPPDPETFDLLYGSRAATSRSTHPYAARPGGLARRSGNPSTGTASRPSWGKR